MSTTRSLPLTAGALLISGAIYRHSAVRGDVPPRLHPLVRRLLDDLPLANRERYAGWCAEAVLISDRLYAAEQDAGQAAPPGSLAPSAARQALWGGVVRVVRVREDGDPAHGTPCRPCRSCASLLDWFGVEAADVGGPGQATTEPSPRTRSLAGRWALELAAYAAPDGRRHEVVAPALDAFATLGGQHVRPAGAGEQVAASGYLIDPTLAIHTVRTLTDLAAALGTRLTPVGVEETGAGQLAVDERGRLFVIDHTAEWWLGDSVAQGLDALSHGRAPARLRADGTWT